MPSFPSILGTTFAVFSIINLSQPQEIFGIDWENTLECHKKTYTHKVTQTDPNGRSCWDLVTLSACWGRCSSNEIGDWRFPFKKSHHPVCIHGQKSIRTVILKNCESEVVPGTEIHEFVDADSCQCAVCQSLEANCQGARYRGEEDLLSFFKH